MAPNASFEVAPYYTQCLNVAKRKEANELRKSMKPLLEKRRRARINDSLNHLKTLIIPLIGKDNTRCSKFEKADVLEMTVRFLRDLPNAPDKNPSDSFKDGYKACLQRVSALIPKTNLLDKDTRQRVEEYIQLSISAVEAPVCRNCCAQNSRASSQVNHGVPVFKCSEKSRAMIHANSGLRQNKAQSTVPPVIGNLWRPW